MIASESANRPVHPFSHREKGVDEVGRMRGPRIIIG